MADLEKGGDEPKGPPTTGFKGWLYRWGVLVSPEEQARLRTLTPYQRVQEQSIPQLLLPVPLVLLLGYLYNDARGLGYAAAICVGVVVAVVIVQSQDPGEPGQPGKRKPR